ncbi:DUF4352 domain-containing protein [Pimelobacter simplex]|uniref:DUF4352 domain-containing protein n=1 Tax=Nocardioides simplex TaxID=2045 RepID=UPI003AAF7809
MTRPTRAAVPTLVLAAGLALGGCSGDDAGSAGRPEEPCDPTPAAGPAAGQPGSKEDPAPPGTTVRLGCVELEVTDYKLQDYVGPDELESFPLRGKFAVVELSVVNRSTDTKVAFSHTYFSVLVAEKAYPVSDNGTGLGLSVALPSDDLSPEVSLVGELAFDVPVKGTGDEVLRFRAKGRTAQVFLALR